MSEKKAPAAPVGDNPNKDGAVRADKFDLREGDIEWIKPPGKGKGKRVNAGPETATVKTLSRAQKADLKTRIRAKLGMAAAKGRK